jgi:hypothetical protein
LNDAPAWSLSPVKLKKLLLSSYNRKIGKNDSLKERLRSSMANQKRDWAHWEKGDQTTELSMILNGIKNKSLDSKPWVSLQKNIPELRMASYKILSTNAT